MKIVTILGTRPQFIKAAAVSAVFREHFDEIIIHTGQHYDANMSDVFFEELSIPKPKHKLTTGTVTHGAMTAAMLTGIEEILLAEKPDFVMVYGDTNSTLAGALAASKLLIPLIHVEAGLRSFNKAMPEEQNRILTDHVSDLLFAPTETAVAHLKNEGITEGVHLIGDVMYDGILHFAGKAQERSTILETLKLKENNYLLCTVHRAENTNNPERLREICSAIGNVPDTVVFPLHPRTRNFLNDYGILLGKNVIVTEPLGYLDMVRLESGAKKIVTDSGGVQKEAFFLGKPCITVRDETEWVETIANGWNILAGADRKRIEDAILNFAPSQERGHFFGDGTAVEKMATIINLYRANKHA